jgi:hypothetical protein
MVTTDVAQLSEECNTWISNLRSFRDEFSHFKNRLQAVAGRQSNRDVLLEIEHLDNQFHIQLINIHDLKHSIKAHGRQVNREFNSNNRQLADDTLHWHEKLYDDYQALESTLLELRDEFDLFIAHIR